MSRITNVLIFKDGYYYLAYLRGERLDRQEQAYAAIPEDKFESFGIDRNGFEFASDAYAYMAFLPPDKQPASNAIALDKEEYNDKEEKRLKETGEV